MVLVGYSICAIKRNSFTLAIVRSNTTGCGIGFSIMRLHPDGYSLSIMHAPALCGSCQATSSGLWSRAFCWLYRHRVHTSIGTITKLKIKNAIYIFIYIYIYIYIYKTKAFGASTIFHVRVCSKPWNLYKTKAFIIFCFFFFGGGRSKKNSNFHALIYIFTVFFCLFNIL